MKRLTPLILIVSSVLIFLIFFEGFLALFWPHKVYLRSYHEQYHPVMGWVNKPNANGYFYPSRNMRFHRHHNNNGLRSLRDIKYEKTKGTKRVLLLGDSFFWGYGVDDKYIVSEVLQRLLGPPYEVINGACPGYGTDQELLWLIEEGIKYFPDIVVLGVFPTNDLDEIAHSIMYGYPKPFFALEDRRPVLLNVPVPDTSETRRKAFEEPQTMLGKIKKFLRFHTHSYPFIAKRLNSIKKIRQFLLKIGLAEDFTSTLSGIPMMVHRPDEIQPLFEALIIEIKKVCHENNSRLVLLFIPEKEATKGSVLKYEGVFERANERNNQFSLYLKKLSEALNIDYIDLLPLIRQEHMRGVKIHNPSRYDHHWTEKGHELAAHLIYSRLKGINKDD